MYKKRKQYRLPGFNYASNWVYFVTIVCSNRSKYFGEIYHDEMILSPMGIIAFEELQSAIKFKKDIDVHTYVIMPNHIHLLVELKNQTHTEPSPGAELPHNQGFERRGRIGPLQKGSLGAFVNRYKGRVTRKCREEGLMDFGWQSRFHDRIIRNQKEYDIIYQYIEDNVVNWDEDSEND